MNRQKQHRGAAAALAVLVLAAVLLFVGGSWLEKRSQKPESRTELPQETAETMEVDGVTYMWSAAMIRWLNFSDLQVGSELTSDVSRQELLDVKQQIEQTGCPILGTVLNQVDYDNYMGRKYYKSYSKYGKYGYYRKYYKRSHEAEKK